MQVEEAMLLIQKDLNSIKKVFLGGKYSDANHAWIVEDYIHSIQATIDAYRNRDLVPLTLPNYPDYPGV